MVALPVFTEAAQRPELGMPQLPASHRPPLITDTVRGSFHIQDSET